jgi:hypothetical protein
VVVATSAGTTWRNFCCVRELPEACDVAVANVPDVDDWEVELLADGLAGTGVADDGRNCVRRRDELDGRRLEVRDVLEERPSTFWATASQVR